MQLAKGNNLGAEDAFKSAMQTKVGDALETKRKEVAKTFVKTTYQNVEEMTKKFNEFYTPVIEKDEHKKSKGYKKLIS